MGTNETRPTERQRALFAGSDSSVWETYKALMNLFYDWPIRIRTRSSSIDLCWKRVFASIHPRKSDLRLDLRTDAPIESPLVKSRMSGGRCHNEVLLASPDDVDLGNLPDWLNTAYEQAGRGGA